MGSATWPNCGMRKTRNNMLAKIRKRAVKLMLAKIRKRSVKLLDAVDGPAMTVALVALTLTMSFFWLLSESAARLQPTRPSPASFFMSGYYASDKYCVAASDAAEPDIPRARPTHAATRVG